MLDILSLLLGVTVSVVDCTALHTTLPLYALNAKGAASWTSGIGSTSNLDTNFVLGH